jgi:sucrose phosphorylase
MRDESLPFDQETPNGVMLNAYPDSIGGRLSGAVSMLKKPEFQGAFSLFYILPTFFNSDLDRGFSIIDYDLNDDLVSPHDLEELERLEIMLKFDLVLNHLSVASPQFRDLVKHGDASAYRDFFVDWNEFWLGHGTMGERGYIVPRENHLAKLFMRKPDLPILKVGFPDGSDRPYWNTFYQKITYREIDPQDLSGIPGMSAADAIAASTLMNEAIRAEIDPPQVELSRYSAFKSEILSIVERGREYLGQMDLNARSPKVWEFYDATLRKLRSYGAKIIRLDAFAYLHKEPGKSNFFNRPGTWNYLERLRQIAKQYDLIVFPEIHAEYGARLHEEVATKGYPIYDFFFPGLLLDAIDRGTSKRLLSWIRELDVKGLRTINMLGCHDGIPMLDLRGAEVNGVARPGLLSDEKIIAAMQRIIARGGRVKNLYGSDGKQIAYYQVNATFFSALGEDEQKLRLARAVQMFMPGIPQVWYLDLFAGKNDYAAADRGGTAGHKEINRTNLAMEKVEEGLARKVVRDQLQLIKLRNNSRAFRGRLEIRDTAPHLLHLSWHNQDSTATLEADLRDSTFRITHITSGESTLLTFP